MMDERYIKSATAIIKIRAEENILWAIVNDSFFASYIPSVKILDEEDKIENINATITIEKIKENKLEINYPNIYYGCKQINTKDIISLIEYIMERARQEEGIICIHGAGAIRNNQLIACWGPATGMGKTSLALALMENGNLFYSDEKILIDLKNKKAVGRIKNQYVSNQYWKEKYGKEEYHEPINLACDIPYEIGLFIQPIICKQKDDRLDKWDENKFAWHLYEEASRKIRGTSRVFFENTYPAMTLDTEQIALQRLNLIKEFAKTVPAIYYKGKIDKIVELINER